MNTTHNQPIPTDNFLLGYIYKSELLAKLDDDKPKRNKKARAEFPVRKPS